jgi:hypothetical protein
MITRFKLVCPGSKALKLENIKSQDQMVYHAILFNLKISYLYKSPPK